MSSNFVTHSALSTADPVLLRTHWSSKEDVISKKIRIRIPPPWSRKRPLHPAWIHVCPSLDSTTSSHGVSSSHYTKSLISASVPRRTVPIVRDQPEEVFLNEKVIVFARACQDYRFLLLRRHRLRVSGESVLFRMIFLIKPFRQSHLC